MLMPECSPTVNDIVRRYWDTYRKKYTVTDHENKVMRHIARCRTEALGARVRTCDKCGYTVTLYNSCRDRNCPQCQSMKKEKWILDKKQEVLPFQYFHVVFTLPDKLNPLVLRNKKVVYNLLFEKVKETLLSAALEKKYFGARIGFFAVLHTWGQKLNLHPHLHCVVPGGGYDERKKRWKKCRPDYLLPVRVLTKRFRSLFLVALKEKYRNNELSLSGCCFDNPEVFQGLIDDLFETEWVVYLKESFKNEAGVIEYLGRYTHRIAISNYRIIKLENDEVYFTYKDYKSNNARKVMKMHAVDFIRRFSLHIVGPRYVRIRYFGLLSHRKKKQALGDCREFYEINIPFEKKEYTWTDLLLRVTGIDPYKCPRCQAGRLIEENVNMTIDFRAPPGMAM
jgi:predicted Zn-ribbon and HTH transcriptional regulator